MKFENKIRRLEEITEIIKSSAVDFDEQLKLYKEGAGLAEEVEKELENAEQMIIEIKDDDQKKN